MNPAQFERNQKKIKEIYKKVLTIYKYVYIMICANFAETDRFAHFSFLQGGVSNMRVTIDLDRDIIIIPTTFSRRLKKKMRS